MLKDVQMLGIYAKTLFGIRKTKLDSTKPYIFYNYSKNKFEHLNKYFFPQTPRSSCVTNMHIFLFIITNFNDVERETSLSWRAKYIFKNHILVIRTTKQKLQSIPEDVSNT